VSVNRHSLCLAVLAKDLVEVTLEFAVFTVLSTAVEQ
jgi:hypothetical protein